MQEEQKQREVQLREEQQQRDEKLLQMMHQMMESNKTPLTPHGASATQDSQPQAQAPTLHHSKTRLEQNTQDPKQKGGSSVKQEPTTNDGELSDGEQRKLLEKLGIDIPLEQLKQLRDVNNLTLDTAKLQQMVELCYRPLDR